MSKSYDLSTSSKWANLADGDHVVKLRAKGAGYGTSSFSNSVTVTKGIAMPAKGDLITIESKQYRVLKTNGSVAEVLAMYDASSSVLFDTGGNNIYAGKNVDTYCNNTFYSALSLSMKGAILDKSFMQEAWNRSNSSISSSQYTGKRSGSAYYVSPGDPDYGESITRHCYCLSVQDILIYLDVTTSMDISNTTLTDTNLWKMFWDATVSQADKNIWLSTASTLNNISAFYVDGNVGSLGIKPGDNSLAARPAFQIDLSKIEWSPVGGGN